MKLNLSEVLNTKRPISWHQNEDGQWRGTFKMADDSSDEFEIHLDELELTLDGAAYSIIDFGFTKNGSWELNSSDGNSSGIFGAVLNGAIPRIKILDPDFILYGVNNKNGATEGRTKLYARFAGFFSKGSKYHWQSPWVETKNGKYSLIGKKVLNDAEMKEAIKFAESIPEK